MKLIKFTFALVLIISTTGVFAQVDKEKKETKSTFCINGEFRNRTEFSPSIDGRNVLVPEETNSSANIWQRSRIVMSYNSDKIETKFSIQDVRPFVQNDTWKSNNGGALSVHEAWAKYYFVNNDSKKLGLKIGRQVIYNADARLIWGRDWNHYGAAHDAIMLECNNKDFDLDWQLGLSLNSANAPGMAVSPKYRNIGYFNFTKRFGKVFTLHITDLFETYENGISDAVYGKNTVGFNPVLKLSDFTFNGSFYYQHGTPAVIAGTVEYASMLYTANAWYKIGKVKIGAGYDSYSGEAYDDDGTDLQNKVFSAPYAAGHKFFGGTDFHLKLFAKGRGLTDINFKLKAALSKKTGIVSEFHMVAFQQMNVYEDNDGNDVEFNTVGNNIDFILYHNFAKKMSVKLGYSVLLPSEDFVNYALENNDLDAKHHGWAWLMFTFKPNMFKSEK